MLHLQTCYMLQSQPGTVSFTWTHLRLLEEHSLDVWIWLLRVVISGQKDQRVEEALLLCNH